METHPATVFQAPTSRCGRSTCSSRSMPSPSSFFLLPPAPRARPLRAQLQRISISPTRPPTLPRLSLSHGLHVYGLERQVNPLNLKTYYVENRDHVVPLGFFVRGDRYSFLGLFELRRPLCRCQPWALREPAPRSRDRSGAAPRCVLLSSEPIGLGQDIFSRIIYASQVSLFHRPDLHCHFLRPGHYHWGHLRLLWRYFR